MAHVALPEHEYESWVPDALRQIEEIGYQIGFSGSAFPEGRMLNIHMDDNTRRPFRIVGHSLFVETLRQAWVKGKKAAAKVADDAQGELDSYIEAQAVAVDPIKEAEDVLRSAGYRSMAALVDAHTKSYQMYIHNGKRWANIGRRALKGELADVCRQWVKDEAFRQSLVSAHRQEWGQPQPIGA